MDPNNNKELENVSMTPNSRLAEQEALLQLFFDFDWTLGGRRERVLDHFQVDPGISTHEFAKTLNDEDLISGFVLFEKAYENKQVLENGRDKKHT